MWQLLLRGKFILLVLGVHLLFLLPLFHPGLFHTHDGQLHIPRIAAYFKALSDGQLPVRWASDLNYGYGSPLFIFYYPLPYFLGSALHAIGFSFIDSFKVLLGTAFVFAPICFYLWLRMLFPPYVAAVSAIVYGLAPYHFLDLFVRGAIGELFSFVFIPLVLLSIEKKTILAGAVWYGLLILSHNAFALVFTAVLAFYALLRKPFVSVVKILTIGLGLSAFFWLPAMMEQRFTHSDLFISKKYLENFPTLMQLIWSPWGFSTEVAKPGGLSPQIGPINVLIIVLSLFFIKKYKQMRWLFYFGIVLLVGSVFLSLEYSIFAWNNLTFLKKFEFPWRFTAVSSFSAAILSALVFSTVRKKWLMIATLLLLVFVSVTFTRIGPYEYFYDSNYLNYAHSTEFGAASTIWSAGDPIAYPKEPVEIISGNGVLSNYQRKPRVHAFSVEAQDQIAILDNTLYFPGWKVTVDDQKVPIEFQDANHRGLITFFVPKGKHHVTVRFTESPIRLISDIISLTTFSALVLIIFRRFRI